jgi:ABC-type multidrug transport system fused ATPase/permease subunit
VRGCGIVLCACLIFDIYSISYRSYPYLHDTAPHTTGLLGFTLVYCSALSGLFQWMVRQSAEVENQMTAVERISAYAALPAEEGYKTAMPVRGGGGGGGEVEGVEMVKGQGQGQVGEGRLQILDLTATYRSDLPPVLRRITLDIPAGAKVGV